jgi:hypothetical protein
VTIGHDLGAIRDMVTAELSTSQMCEGRSSCECGSLLLPLCGMIDSPISSPVCDRAKRRQVVKAAYEPFIKGCNVSQWLNIHDVKSNSQQGFIGC